MIPLALFVSALAILSPSTAGAASAPQSLAYVLQADLLSDSKAAAVAILSTCGRDWIVLDTAFDRDTPWVSSDLDAIRAGKPGRVILAYLSIGEAEDYRPYWRNEWTAKNKRAAAPPVWLRAENPDWKGNYRVNYWHPEWQNIVLAAVDRAMTLGFDGLYLDIVDGFETFEEQGKDYLPDRLNPETRQTFRRDMVDFVKAIAARARSTNPGAIVIPQNGSQLLAHPDFAAAVSGIGIEDLFTNGDRLQPAAHSADILRDVQNLTAQGKPVLLIEYPTRPDRRALSMQRAKENGFTWLLTDRPLKTLGSSGR